MSDYLNKKVLLVGATRMAMEYYKVLQALDCNTTVVGRGQKNADEFSAQTKAPVYVGGVEKFLAEKSVADFDAVLVAVGVEQLAPVARQLLVAGAKHILLEKPGGLDSQEIQALADMANAKKAQVLVAYNRRFYASVLKAEEIIKADGGVKSFVFEFTEWAQAVSKTDRKPEVLAHWLLANSTHVIDMAFFLGGKPLEIKCFSAGNLNWHEHSMFYGAGSTENQTFFSYQANWDAPGRWVVEIITDQHRLIFKPLEELQIQVKGSVEVKPVEIDNSLDLNFKPGLYRQLQAFLTGDDSRFKTIAQQAQMSLIYEQMAKGN